MAAGGKCEALENGSNRPIRVNGCDIERGAGERDEYVLSCRVYRTESGLEGEPNERWLRDALHVDG